MIFGYLLLIVLAGYVGYRVLAAMGIVPSGNGAAVPQKSAPKSKPKPFDVNSMSPAELRLKYRLNFATAVNFERNREGSGIAKQDAVDAVDKLILIRHRLAVIDGEQPIGGSDKSVDDYRAEVVADIRDAAKGGQA